ncbi:MAG: hypothetical protein KDA84_05505, partial [Planctomycetaceae bacterium]|nr:hypothetical protein [Planctomycetaceae bacterium]
VLAQSIWFVQTRPLHLVRYEGVEAVALGVAYLAIGLFIHSHFFLMTFESQYFLGEIGKLLSIVLILGSFVIFFVHVLFYS